MRVALFLLAIAVACASCVSTTSPASGTLRGHVLSSPCAPIERLDSPCTGLGVAHATLTLHHDATTITTITDAQGAYSSTLATGRWTVTLAPRPPFGQSRSDSVTITPGANVVLDFHIDSGIR